MIPKRGKSKRMALFFFLFNGLNEKTFPFSIVLHNKDDNNKKLNYMHSALNWEYLIRRTVGNKFSISCCKLSILLLYMC